MTRRTVTWPLKSSGKRSAFAGAGGAGFVDAAEAFEEGGGDAHADLVSDDGGVEGFGFSAVDEDEVGAVAGGAAGGEGEAEEGEGGEAGHAGG